MPDGSSYSETQQGDIFANYLAYVGITESPTIYHRWSYLSALGAVLGRSVYLEHGHFRIFPNLFLMFLGEPAVRKSTAIKMAKKLVAASGYEFIGASKTSGTSKFLMDLAGISDDKNEQEIEDVTSQNLWGHDEPSGVREVYVMADEFNAWAGPGGTDFYTTLGDLWDWDDPLTPFTQRFKNSTSVSISQPTVSILSANTPVLFSRAFPPETLGTGFLSRLLLIHGERTGRRITFPQPPDPEIGAGLAEYLRTLRRIAGQQGESGNGGKLSLHSDAILMLDDIYQNPTPVPDLRFANYNERRFTHLLKICLIIAAAKFKGCIEAEDVLQANTMLAHADRLMPKAMGEFGKSKHSDIAQKLMSILDRATMPVSMKELLKEVTRDCNAKELQEIVQGLIAGDRVQVISGHGRASGFLPKKIVSKEPVHVDWSFLTQEERDMR